MTESLFIQLSICDENDIICKGKEYSLIEYLVTDIKNDFKNIEHVIQSANNYIFILYKPNNDFFHKLFKYVKEYSFTYKYNIIYIKTPQSDIDMITLDVTFHNKLILPDFIIKRQITQLESYLTNMYYNLQQIKINPTLINKNTICSQITATGSINNLLLLSLIKYIGLNYGFKVSDIDNKTKDIKIDNKKFKSKKRTIIILEEME